MTNSHKMIKDSAVYSLSTICAQLIGVVTSIAMRRLLTPDMMGIWATFLVILNYALFAEAGVFTAAEVKIPYLRGREEKQRIHKIRNCSFTFALVIAFFFILLAYIYSTYVYNGGDDYMIMGIRMIGLIISVTLLYNLYIVFLRADKRFFDLSRVMLMNSAFMLFFVATLTYLFGLRGLFVASLLATFLSWIYIAFTSKYNVRLSFDITEMMSLAKTGLPILLAGVTYTVLISVDKIIIIRMLGPVQLGLYSIAILAFTYTNAFPKIFGIVIFPNMQEAYGRTDSKEHIFAYVERPALIMASLLPVLLALAYYGIPVLVEYVLPKYRGGVNSMKILLAGCFFISLAPLAQNFVIALGRQIVLIPIMSVAVVLGLGVNYFMIKIGWGISGVAVGTSLSYFMYFAGLFLYTLLHCEKVRGILSFYYKVILPFLYAVLLLMLMESMPGNGSIVTGNLIRALFFLALYSPVVVYIDHKTGILKTLVSRLRRKGVLMNS